MDNTPINKPTPISTPTPIASPTMPDTTKLDKEIKEIRTLCLVAGGLLSLDFALWALLGSRVLYMPVELGLGVVGIILFSIYLGIEKDLIRYRDSELHKIAPFLRGAMRMGITIGLQALVVTPIVIKEAITALIYHGERQDPSLIAKIYLAVGILQLIISIPLILHDRKNGYQRKGKDLLEYLPLIAGILISGSNVILRTSISYGISFAAVADAVPTAILFSIGPPLLIDTILLIHQVIKQK